MGTTELETRESTEAGSESQSAGNDFAKAAIDEVNQSDFNSPGAQTEKASQHFADLSRSPGDNRDYASGQLLVSFKDSSITPEQVQSMMEKFGILGLERISGGLYTLKFGRCSDMQALADEIRRKQPEVEHAEPNYVMYGGPARPREEADDTRPKLALPGIEIIDSHPTREASEANKLAESLRETLDKIQGQDLSEVFSAKPLSGHALAIARLFRSAEQIGEIDGKSSIESLLNTFNTELEKRNSDFRLNMES